MNPPDNNGSFIVVLTVSENGSSYFDSGRKLSFILGKDRCWSYPDLRSGVLAVQRLLAEIIKFEESDRASRACSAAWFVNQQEHSAWDWTAALERDGLAVVIEADTRKASLQRIVGGRHGPGRIYCAVGARLPPQAASPDFPLLEFLEVCSLE